MGSFTQRLTRLQWNCQLGLQVRLRCKSSCKLTWFLAEFISLQLQSSWQLASLRAVYGNLWAQESPKPSFKEFTWLSQAHLKLSLWLTQSRLVRDLSLHQQSPFTSLPTIIRARLSHHIHRSLTFTGHFCEEFHRACTEHIGLGIFINHLRIQVLTKFLYP